MPRKLKVYGGNLDGRNRAVVAAHSLAECARLLDTTPARIRDYFGETGNPEDVSAAMAEPGVVFLQSMTRYGAPYIRRSKSCHQAPGGEA